MVREGSQVANRHDRGLPPRGRTPANHSRVYRRNRAQPLPPSHPTLLRASVDGYTARSRIDFSRLTRCSMSRPLLAFVLVAPFALPPHAARADVFDDASNALLRSVLADRPTIKSFDRAQATALKPLAKTVEGSLLVLKSTEGNIAKALVTFGFRKGPRKTGRRPDDRPFVAYGPATGDTSVAVARNVMLFPGFEFDIDLGQVVRQVSAEM